MDFLAYLRKVVGGVCRALLLVLSILYIVRHDALHRQALGEIKLLTSGPDARPTLACLDYCLLASGRPQRCAVDECLRLMSI